MKRHLALSLTAICCLSASEVYDLGVIEVSAKSDIHAISTDTSSQKDIKNAKNKTILEALRTKLVFLCQVQGLEMKIKLGLKHFTIAVWRCF